MNKLNEALRGIDFSKKQSPKKTYSIIIVDDQPLEKTDVSFSEEQIIDMYASCLKSTDTGKKNSDELNKKMAKVLNDFVTKNFLK